MAWCYEWETLSYSYIITVPVAIKVSKGLNLICDNRTKGFTPGLSVDVGTVEQGGQEALSGTHTAQHQVDPIQRGQ